MTEQKDKCPKCKGRGELYASSGEDPDMPDGFDCPTCNGTGQKKLDRPLTTEEKEKEFNTMLVRNRQGLDRPDREKIQSLILGHKIKLPEDKELLSIEGFDKAVIVRASEIADQILALIEPLIEEARATTQEIERNTIRRNRSWLANVCGWRNPEQIQELLEEAVAAKSIIFAQASERAALDLKKRWQKEASGKNYPKEAIEEAKKQLLADIEKYEGSYIDKRFWGSKFWQALKNNMEENIGKDKGKV